MVAKDWVLAHPLRKADANMLTVPVMINASHIRLFFSAT
jgi:hypothetical protein